MLKYLLFDVTASQRKRELMNELTELTVTVDLVVCLAVNFFGCHRQSLKSIEVRDRESMLLSMKLNVDKL